MSHKSTLSDTYRRKFEQHGLHAELAFVIGESVDRHEVDEPGAVLLHRLRLMLMLNMMNDGRGPGWFMNNRWWLDHGPRYSEHVEIEVDALLQLVEISQKQYGPFEIDFAYDGEQAGLVFTRRETCNECGHSERVDASQPHSGSAGAPRTACEGCAAAAE